MTHQEFDERLDKELDWQVHLIVWEAVMQGVSANNKDLKITEEMLKQAKAEAKQSIRELFVEVVGGDESWDVGMIDVAGVEVENRNQLRQQLRTTIKGEEGGE